MSVKVNYYSNFISLANVLSEIFVNFNSSGKILVSGQRNTIKLFEVYGVTLNIKSFKIPNLINSIIYKFFRKSKARRSYEFAKILPDNDTTFIEYQNFKKQFGEDGNVMVMGFADKNLFELEKFKD